MPFLESMDWALPMWACVNLRGVAQRVAEALLNPKPPPPGRWVVLGPGLCWALWLEEFSTSQSDAREHVDSGASAAVWFPASCGRSQRGRIVVPASISIVLAGWMALHAISCPLAKSLLEFTHTASNRLWGSAV
jgi:hypothetical protein